MFGSVSIGPRVNVKLYNINFAKLFSQEPYQCTPNILISFGDSSWS